MVTGAPVSTHVIEARAEKEERAGPLGRQTRGPETQAKEEKAWGVTSSWLRRSGPGEGGNQGRRRVRLGRRGGLPMG